MYKVFDLIDDDLINGGFIKWIWYLESMMVIFFVLKLRYFFLMVINFINFYEFKIKLLLWDRLVDIVLKYWKRLMFKNSDFLFWIL